MSGRRLRGCWFAGIVLVGLGGLVASSAIPVSAHAELTGSTPSPGAVLESAPREVVLTFDDELSDESTFSVEDGAGAEVGSGELDLDVIDRNVMRGGVEIGDPGEFRVVWSATDAIDGDTTTGEFTFRVSGEGPATSSTAGSTAGPNTALAGGSASMTGATLSGAILLAASGLAAVGLGVRARRRRRCRS